MCRWMGSHFHDWTDYNGFAFLVQLITRMGSHIFGISGIRKFWKDLNIVRRFAVKNGSCCCFKIQQSAHIEARS